MPRVPGAPQRTVRDAAAPASRINLDTSGLVHEPFSVIGEALGGAAEFVGVINERQDQLDIRQRKTGYLNDIRDLRYGDDGFEKDSNQTAVDRAKERQEQIAAIRTKHLTGLSNKNRREFDPWVVDQEMRLSNTHAAHVSRHQENALKLATQAEKDQNIQLYSASGEPEALAHVVNVARDEARQNGITDEATVQQLMLSASTSALEGRIDIMVAQNRQAEAKVLFEQNKDMINPERHDEIITALNRADQARLSALRREASQVTAALDAGFSPNDVNPLLAELDATPGDQATLIASTVREAQADQAIVAGWRQSGTVSEKKVDMGTLHAEATAGNLNADQIRQMERMSRAYARDLTLINQGNGLQAAVENGQINQLVPLDINDPDTLSAREAQAEQATAALGVNVSPLLASEAASLVRTLTGDDDTGQPVDINTSAQTLNSLRAALSENSLSALAEQTASQAKAPAVAIAMIHPDIGTGVEILRGSSLARQNKDLLPSKNDRLAVAETQLGNMFNAGSVEARDNIMAAADAIYVNRAAQLGLGEFDDELYEQSMQDAVGGIGEYGGRKFILPGPGVTESQVLHSLRQATEGNLLGPNGEHPGMPDGEDFDPTIFTDITKPDIQLMSTGLAGQYMLFLPGTGQFVAQKEDPRERFIWDLRGQMERGQFGVAAGPGTTGADLAAVEPGFQSRDVPFFRGGQ